MLTLSLGISPWSLSAQEDVADEIAFRRISNKLICQCGCNYMVLSCNHVDCPSATYIRRVIKTSLGEGKSDEEIIAGFVQEYGVRVLPEPPREGFSWMAWIMPFAGLGLGALAVSYVLVLWKRKEHADGSDPSDDEALEGNVVAAPPSPELVAKYRDIIDEELSKEG